jgi:hypothetical protein
MCIIVALLHYFRILVKKVYSTDTVTHSKITINSKRINGDEYTQLTSTEKNESTDLF